MSNRALNKNTFGTKNKEWIDKCGIVAVSIFIVLVLFYLLEWIYLIARDKSKIHKDSVGQAAVIVFCLVFYIILDFVAFLILATVETKPLNFRQNAKILGTITLVLIVCQFNPLIIWLKKDSGIVHDAMKYTILVQSITLPFFLSASISATWILWKMSKVKPDYDGDEPYEVVYGGEGSSTKKSDESTE